MKKILFLFLVLISQSSFGDTSDDKIAKYAKKTFGNDCGIFVEETLQYKHTTIAHVVTTSCGGGNHWEEYMILYSQMKGYTHTQIGGKGVADIESMKIVGDTLITDGKSYAPEDAYCCPTIPLHIEIQLNTK